MSTQRTPEDTPAMKTIAYWIGLEIWGTVKHRRTSWDAYSISGEDVPIETTATVTDMFIEDYEELLESGAFGGWDLKDFTVAALTVAGTHQQLTQATQNHLLSLFGAEIDAALIDQAL